MCGHSELARLCRAALCPPARKRWGSERSEWGRSPVSPQGEPLSCLPGQCAHRSFCSIGLLLLSYLLLSIKVGALSGHGTGRQIGTRRDPINDPLHPCFGLTIVLAVSLATVHATARIVLSGRGGCFRPPSTNSFGSPALDVPSNMQTRNIFGSACKTNSFVTTIPK